MSFALQTKNAISLPFPTFICCIFIILDFFDGWLFHGLSAYLSLIGVYYWALYRPDLLNPLALFVTSLVIDLLSFNTVGTTSCMVLGLYAMIILRRYFFIKQPFIKTWGIFFLILLGFRLFSTLIFLIFDSTKIPIADLLQSTILNCFYTAALFPFLFKAFYHIQNWLVGDET